MSPPLLEVRDLRTWIRTDGGPAQAVDGVSFRVEAGETVGLVGESGCGKTMTALSLLGLHPAPAARILEGSSVRLAGEELVGASPARLREVRGRRIAMVFQEPMTSLNPVYPVGEQVAESLRLHEGVGRREARRRVVELFGEVGIPDPEGRLDAYPHQLSGGLRQRVVIAMALASDPELLLADEPTTALDVTVQARILELLAELQARRGTALLLITHDLGVVARTCRRVLVMYAGQVVEEGATEEVLQAPRHPYTRGLLDSLPSGGEEGARLRPIPGSVPPATAWPGGCRFRDRCSFVVEGCETPQELLEVGRGRAVRCHRAGELGVLEPARSS